MTDHERIEELLAGYSLRSLSGEDAAEADRLLSDHVPDCRECRDTLGAYRAVAADLALAAAPLDPPETLLARLRHELEPRGRRPRVATTLAIAASVVAVIGLAGTLTQGRLAGQASEQRDAINNILRFTQEHDATLADVGPATEVAAPGVGEFFLYGENIPSPPDGSVYGVWLVSGDVATFAGSFVPTEGWVYVHLEFDPTAYDELWICVESAGSVPSVPGEIVWRSAA